MLPTLTLGIPGNAPAAALIAALTLHHVVVGPTIEVDHPGLIYFIYAALILSNCIMLVAAFMLIKPCVKLFSLPRGIRLPLILPVCVIGAYAVRSSMFDVWVMLSMGLVGLVMTRLTLPLAPFVIGFVLEPIAESHLTEGLMQSGGSWMPLVTRPMSLLFLIAAFVLFVLSIVQNVRVHRTAQA